MIFVNDVFPEMGDPLPSKSSMWVYVPDVDASFERAVKSGATVGMPPNDTFWGDRMGQLSDPYGQKWTLATCVKNMTPDEIKQSLEEMLKKAK
jgi:uncharacterized glyoxalase superfamily protein PhnB